MSAGKPPLLPLCYLWKRTDKLGKVYFVGTLGRSRVFAFFGDAAASEPDLKLFLGAQIETEKNIAPRDRSDANGEPVDQEVVAKLK